MKRKGTAYHKKAVAAAVAMGCAVALALSTVIAMGSVKAQLDDTCDRTTESFTAIMQNYTHSFQLFEELLRLKIDSGTGADEVEAYLKQEDARLKKIEGEDFDGVYMCYQGRYLYSWDTPYSVYEESGYEVTARPWYIGAVEAKGQIFFSVPYRSYANDYMLATISRLQPDGETVVAYDIKLGAIQDYAEHMHLYNGSLTMLCDESGNIIGTTEPLYAGATTCYPSRTGTCGLIRRVRSGGTPPRRKNKRRASSWPARKPSRGFACHTKRS